MSSNYYECDYLYQAIAFGFAEYHIGRAISEDEYAAIKETKNENQEYILLAKELIKSDPEFIKASTEEKVGMIRRTVLLLYQQDKNLINKAASFLEPDNKKKTTKDKKTEQKTLRFLV